MEKLRKIGFSKLTPLDEAMEKLFSRIALTPNEEIKTFKALNRILGEDIISGINVPQFDRSAMDGYAIKAEDSFEASHKNPKQVKLVGRIDIGEVSNLVLNKGQSIRISTGAAIPNGADAVIKIEDTEIEEQTVFLNDSIVPGKNVSKEGEDIKVGTKVLENGIELKPEHLSLLVSLGISEIKVRIKPKISFFATGDELIEVGQPLEQNKIYNSNSVMISSLVNLYGGKIVRALTLKDDKNSIKFHLLEASKDSDIIICTGGTSVGTKDFLPEILHESGEILTHGIAMRPGSPILTSLLQGTLTFCLPGTPVAAYVCFLKIVGPSLRKMMGCAKIDPRLEILANISKDVPVSKMGFLNYLRVKLIKKKNNIIATPVRLKGSGIISSLTESDGIIEIPQYQEGLRKGAQVIVKLFPK
jgi:molybdenum cofactor synthesis domain-containing protein